MAYVPPHRRKKDGSEKREYDYPLADVQSENYARRVWFAVDANGKPPPNLKLSFKPSSISHMPDNRVFTLSVNVENDIRPLMDDVTPPWRYTSNKIKDDLKKCFHKIESRVKKSKLNYAMPAFTARFGILKFHGSQIAWHESFTLENLEKIFNVQSDSPNPSRSFDTNLPRDIFEAIKEKVIVSLATPTLKKKNVYQILVGNDLYHAFGMVVTCQKKDVDDKQIELKKIEIIRKHFFRDTSCLNKVVDWRLSVTQKYLVDLDEEDKECIEGIVRSARIDGNAKGGLVWPHRGHATIVNRFRVTAVWNLNVTTIVGETWDIKFQQVYRVKHADSYEMKSPLSYEIDLKLKSISRYVREQKPWEEENIMNILEDNLKWVWMEVLS